MQSTPERREAAILYAQLRNFTRLAEALPPEKVLELADDFFSLTAIAVTANSGKVLAVQNDTLLAAFAARDRKEFTARALKAAQDLQREFTPVGAQWKDEFGLPAAAAAGAHLGEAVFGMAGPPGGRQFVAFGDCVSVCERLVHRARAGEIVMSLDFVKALGTGLQAIGAKELPPIEIPRRAPIQIFGIALETRLDFT